MLSSSCKLPSRLHGGLYPGSCSYKSCMSNLWGNQDWFPFHQYPTSSTDSWKYESSLWGGKWDAGGWSTRSWNADSKPKDWWMRRYVHGTSEQMYMSCTINSHSIAWDNVLIFANYLLFYFTESSLGLAPLQHLFHDVYRFVASNPQRDVLPPHGLVYYNDKVIVWYLHCKSISGSVW